MINTEMVYTNLVFDHMRHDYLHGHKHIINKEKDLFLLWGSLSCFASSIVWEPVSAVIEVACASELGRFLGPWYGHFKVTLFVGRLAARLFGAPAGALLLCSCRMLCLFRCFDFLYKGLCDNNCALHLCL